MQMKSCIFALFAIVVACVAQTAQGREMTVGKSNSKTEVWFSPESHYPPRPESDFLELFAENANWSDAASHIDMMKLSTQFFLKAPPAVLQNVVRNLKMRGIGLAIEAQVQCRVNTPAGAAPIDLAHTIIENIKKAGGQLNAVSADGSLFAVLTPVEKGGCASDIPTAAGEVASVLLAYKQAFPSASLGDIEPVPLLLQKPNWQQLMMQFYKSLAESGAQLQFVDVDFDWRSPELTHDNIHVSDPSKIAAAASAMGKTIEGDKLRLGVIINGKSDAKSDIEWATEAMQNAAYLNSAIRPSRLIFQSWHTHPFKALPETESGSFTNLIDAYFQQPAKR